jgi:hypothetical protein
MSGIAAIAADSPSRRYVCAASGGAQAYRCAFAEEPRDLHRSLTVPFEREHFLHEADFQCALCGVLVAKKEVVHRIAPAGTRKVPEVRAARRRDSTFGFELTEARRISGNDDVTRQHHFDANRIPSAEVLGCGLQFLGFASGQHDARALFTNDSAIKL